MRVTRLVLLQAIAALCLFSRSASADWLSSLSSLFTRQQSVTCPPSGFNSVANFSITAYAASPWYPQQQVPLLYQKQDSLYCVQAQYKLINASKPSAGLYVYNSANKGSVNGSSMGSDPSSSFQMVALPDPSGEASKLQVGPKQLSFLKSLAYGPYWVVAVGPSDNATLGYDWAVVTGGAPKHASNSRCSTFNTILPTTWQYQGGLWLFTRKPVDPIGAAAALAAATSLGLDTSGLVPVLQKGCIYPPKY